MNDIKDKWSKSEGIYVLASTKVNEKPNWLQEGGNFAIWYDSARTNWNLGYASDLGSSTAKFLTDYKEGTALPHATPWKRNLNGRWTASDDILVTLVKGNIVFIVYNIYNFLKISTLQTFTSKRLEPHDFLFLTHHILRRPLSSKRFF
jgi:hypothetical protein